MMPEVARATRPEPSTSADQRERLIESVSQLLSSGRPLSEILAEAKELASSDTQGGPIRATLSKRKPSSIESLKAAVFARAEQENGKRFRFPQRPRFSASSRNWHGAAIGAAVLATTAATALIANLRMADAVSVVPTLIAKPAAEPTRARPAEPQLMKVAEKPYSSKAIQLRVSADVLVSRGDLRSARLLYERAVDFADAQAALRLGATYDPAFLSWAALGDASGDPVQAAYWYKRARDLGAISDAETLLKGISLK
jgi:TPR repeat protein